MIKQITMFNGHKIYYSLEGKGTCVVLLHGFTESMDIWDDFFSILKKDFCTLCVDLPGHGQSDCIGETHSMELMAEVVRHVLDIHGIETCVVLGHSMGGYVSLAFAEKYPEMMKGLCLFHSSATADPPETKYNRERTIEYVMRHHTAFLSTFIPDLFAPASRKIHAAAIQALVERAKKMTPESIIAAQRGMMLRPDRTQVLSALKVPVLFILGKLDSRQPFDLVLQQVAFPENALLLSLGGVGHMGYIEAHDATLHTLKTFVQGLS